MMTSSVSVSRSSSFRNRVSSVNSPRISRRNLVSKVFKILAISGSVLSCFLAIITGYLYVLPSLKLAFHDLGLSDFTTTVDASTNSTATKSVCDIYDGNWVVDDTYPLYNASECPYVEQGFNCLENGREDFDYLKWRWKPGRCEIPRFSVGHVLQKLRNKKLVFVGDSMSRTQWESLICLLMTGVEDKKSVYEVNGNKITKQIRFLGVAFTSFNFTIEFFRSVFLVQHSWEQPIPGPPRVRSTLKLDKMDDISDEWIDSDVLIFNSGQWWVPGKLSETGCYFQVGNTLMFGMSITTAFRTALNTWSSWVETMINPNKTRVFFRTFEPSHWSNFTLRWCNVSSEPLEETNGKDVSPFSDAVTQVVKSMKVPVTVLRITPMSAFRSDAHVGIWGENLSFPDCSHWCLPGVPDAWNELLLSYLLP